MSPIFRDYLHYALAVAFGFLVYFGMNTYLKIDFMISIFAGFCAIHLALVLARRFIR
jgi:hypothetical protein